jgi:hypothetical protein
MEDENSILPPPKRTPWNKGKLIGRNKSKSEVSGQSGHCSTRLLAALRVESRCGAVAVGRTYLFPPLSSGGALVVRP